jgi:hypothetical protein
MKVVTPLSLLISGAAFTAVAADESSPKVVSFDVRRSAELQSKNPSAFVSRRAAYTTSLFNNITGGGYYVTVSVGTPGQRMPLVLDTGSSDAWVVSSKADLCTSASVQKTTSDTCGAVYDPSKSSTYKLLEAGGFSITYLDQSSAKGDFITDNFGIGDMTVKSLQIGYATKIVRGTGILGIGFAANEATKNIYPNLVDQLLSQKLIARQAYSLYLNDPRTMTGNILFGGVDTAKFIGNMNYLPILQTASSTSASATYSYSVFAVRMTGLATHYSNGSISNVTGVSLSNPIPAILDSGTTLSYLPDNLAQKVFKQLNAYTDDTYTGYTFVSCSLLSADPDLVVQFSFGSLPITIAVPVHELVLNWLDANATDQLPPNIPFADPCILGIQTEGSISSSSKLVLTEADTSVLATTSSTYILLGDTFLRSAYVIYDLTGKQIGLAPSNLNTTESSITELTGTASALPKFTGVASQQTTATGAAVQTDALFGVTTTRTSSTTATGTGTGGGGGVTVTVTNTQSSAVGALRPPPAGDMLAVFGISMFLVVMGGVLFVV